MADQATDGGGAPDKPPTSDQVNPKQQQEDTKQRSPKMESDSTDSELSDLDPKLFENPSVYQISPVHHHDDFHHGKRRYMEIFDTSVDQSNFTVPTSPKKKQYGWVPGKENWNNSVSSRDSAIGSTSLFSSYGSVLTESSSSFESQSNSEDNTSNVSSPIHSVYGRYQKIYTDTNDKTKVNQSGKIIETLVLHRLPGENLGMILGIEDGVDGENFVSKVIVKTVTLGGAAYRATGSSKGIAVGDEILEVNGIDVKTLSHDECVTVLREMPLRVDLLVKRGQKPSPPVSFSPIPRHMEEKGGQFRSFSKDSGDESYGGGYSSFSESEDDFPEDFSPMIVEIKKDPGENLGISIVPSYGSTRKYYQVKRLLPSGAAARCGKLKVGDRLVSCNGINLRNLAQAQCVGTLKSEGSNGDIELEILRQGENDVPMEISLTVSNGAGFNDSKLTLKSPLPEKREVHLGEIDSESDPDVVLNKFERKEDVYRQPDTNNVTFQDNNFQLLKPQEISPNTDSDQIFFNRQGKNQTEMASVPEQQDQWSFALPPPQEFSDNNGVSDSHVESAGEINVPITNIDDILSDYSPSCSNNSTPIHQAKPLGNDSQLNQLEEIMKLEKDEHFSHHHILMPLPESLREQDTTDDSELDQERDEENVESIKNGNHKQINDVYDSYLHQDDQKGDRNAYKQFNNHDVVNQDQREVESLNDRIDLSYLKQTSRRPVNVVSENKIKGENAISDYQQSNGVADENGLEDDVLVPMFVNRENAANLIFGKKFETESSGSRKENSPSHVEEEVILPLSIQRENAPKPGARSINETQFNERDISPPPKERSRPKPAPRKKKGSESQESVEEILVPITAKKENIENFVIAKLGGEVTEEEIIPSQAERNWDKVHAAILSKLTEGSQDKTEVKKSTPSIFDITKLAQKKEIESTGEPQHVSVIEVNDKKDTDVTVSVVSNAEVTYETPEKENISLLQTKNSSIINDINQDITASVHLDRTSSKLKENVSDLVDNKELINVDSQNRNSNDVVHVSVISHTESPPRTGETENNIVTRSDIIKNENVHVTVLNTGDSKKKEEYTDDKTVGSVPQHTTEIKIDNSQPQSDQTPVNIKTGINLDHISQISVQHSHPDLDSVERVATVSAELKKPTITESKMPPPAVPHKTSPVKSEPPKTKESEVDSKYKSSVAVTAKPPSILGTIKSNTSTSGQMKPLSTIKPVSFTAKSLSLGKPVKYTTTINTGGGKPSLLSTLHGSALSTASAKTSRSEEEPFQISVLKGILGLGIKVKVTEAGNTQVTEIQSSGPIAKDGHLKVGDYLLSINSTELTGLSDSKVQQILRLLPRGLAKINVSAKPPSGQVASGDTKAKVGELNIKTDTETSTTVSSPTSPFSFSPKPYSSQLSPVKSVSPTLHKSPPKPEKPEIHNKEDQHRSSEVSKSPEKNEKKTKPSPPAIPPKPKTSSFFDSVKDAPPEASKKSVGGYVGSALGQRKTFFEKKSHPEPPSYLSSLPHKTAGYVSSAERTTHEDKSHGHKEEEKGPIDTVIFASMSGHKSDHVSTTGKHSDPKHPEPHLIPSGHVDYVTTKPKSPKSPKSPENLSPREKAEQMASKFITDRKSMVINPQRLNSALSPKQHSEPGKSKFAFPAKSPPKVEPRKGQGYSSHRATGKDDDSLISPTEQLSSMDVSPSLVTIETESQKSPISPEDIILSDSKTLNVSQDSIVPSEPHKSPVSQEDISSQIDVSLNTELHKRDENTCTPSVQDEISRISDENELPSTNLNLVHHEKELVVSNEDEKKEPDEKVTDFSNEDGRIENENSETAESIVAKTIVDNVISSALKVMESPPLEEMVVSEKASDVCASAPSAPFEGDSLENDLIHSEGKLETDLVLESKPPTDSDVHDTASDKSLLPDENTEGGKSSYELDASVTVMHDCSERGETNIMDINAIVEQTNILDSQTFDEEDLSPPDMPPTLPSAPPPLLPSQPPPSLPIHTNVESGIVMDDFESSDNLCEQEEIDFDPMSPTKPDFPDEKDLNQDPHNLFDMGTLMQDNTEALVDVNVDKDHVTTENLMEVSTEASVDDNVDKGTAENLIEVNEQSIACNVSLQNECMPVSSHNAPLLPACDDVVNVSKFSSESDRNSELDEFNETEVVDPFSEQDIQESTDLQQDQSESPDLLSNDNAILAVDVDNFNFVDDVTNTNVICDVSSVSEPNVNSENSDLNLENTNIQTSHEKEEVAETPFYIDQNLDVQHNSVINTLDVKDGADTPDTKSLGSLDDLSDSEYAMVTSRRRWSLVIGQQELNVFNNSNRSTPLSFDSSVSNGGLISPDKLSALLDKANETMDQTGLSEDDEIVVVILHKDESNDLIGLQLGKGDKQQIVVSSIDPSGLVANDGRIQVGYNLLSVNGETLKTDNVDKISESLESRKGQIVLVVSKPTEFVQEDAKIQSDKNVEPLVSNSEQLCDKSSSNEDYTPHTENMNGILDGVPKEVENTKLEPPSSEINLSVSLESSKEEKTSVDSKTQDITVDKNQNEKENQSQNGTQTSSGDLNVEDRSGVFEVTMMKGNMGLGLLIEGGRNTPLGDLPLTIKRLIKGGPAEKCGQLRVKDEILSINGEDVSDMTHKDAWTFLKFVDDGEVSFVIRRGKKK